MTENTPLPPYLPYPRFLFGEDLAQTTKLLYALLLDRATLSQKNGWIDENGRLYLVFPVIKIADAMDRKLSPNNLSMNNLSNNDLNRARGKPACFGRYENVILSEEEISELQTELPGSWEQYIERLSEYMASTGKKYSSHAATIRRWAAEDKKKASSKGGLPEYTCKEGESL